MRKSFLLLLMGVLALAMVPMPGHAAGASDGTADTIEPILVKADAQTPQAPFRTNALNEGNITNFTLTTIKTAAAPPGGQAGDCTAGCIQATITTFDPLVRCLTAPCGAGTAPYGGAHVMVLFKTPEQNLITDTGCSNIACTGQSKWTPRHPNDRFYWFLYYGATASEQQEDVSLGIYDPAGRLNGLPLEPGLGQIFGVQGQRYTSCSDNMGTTGPNSGELFPGQTSRGNLSSNTVLYSGNSNFSNGGKTVTLTFPYTYRWRLAATNTNPCALRAKKVVSSGGLIKDAVAFSWADHEIGGPDPVGLILGWTWYLDSVPAIGTTTGYKVGTPSGDPNPGSYAGPTCPLTIASVNNPVDNSNIHPGGQVNPLYTGAPCMIVNPIGPGFGASGINVVAS
jgi:hypothetical protein